MSNADYSHRTVWRIATPMILSNISVPLLGIVDTAVVGHLEHAYYIGAVAIGATVFSFLFMGLNFLRMGTTGLAAQSFGAEDHAALRRVLIQAIATALLMSGLLLILQSPLADIAFRLLEPSSEAESEARLYFAIRIWGAPAALCNFAVIGWLIGLQQTRGALIVMLVINLTNIALDLFFVVGLHWGVSGVAAASVVAEFSGLLAGGWLCGRALQRLPGKWDLAAALDIETLRQLWHINGSLLVRTMSLMFAFGFLTAQGARQGDLILAANALLLNLQYLMSYLLDGVAHAAEALVGRAFGRADRRGLARAIKLSLIWSFALALFSSLGFLLAGQQIIALMTDLDQVRATAATYLPWIVLSPIVSVWSFVYDGIYVGATLARQMRNTMVLSVFGVFVPAWFLLEEMGNHGLWLAFLLFMAARGLSQFIWLRHLEATGKFPAASQ